MVFTPAGMVSCVRLEHCANAMEPISVRDSGKVMLSSDVKPWKQPIGSVAN